MAAKLSYRHAVLALALLLCVCLALAPVSVHAKENTASVTCGFSRDEKAMEMILGLIRESRESILVAAYSFTSKPIAEELRKAGKRGVNVYVVADGKANRSKYTAVTFLANNKIAVRLNDKYAIMHHKFMIIDGRHVQTGSFNYSQSAHKRNAENVLVLRDLPDLAEQFSQEWVKLWNEAKDLPPNY